MTRRPVSLGAMHTAELKYLFNLNLGRFGRRSEQSAWSQSVARGEHARVLDALCKVGEP